MKGEYYVEKKSDLVSILEGFNILQVVLLIFSPPIFLWEGDIAEGTEFGGGISFIVDGDFLE